MENNNNKLYILNSPVLTDYGMFWFEKEDIVEAKKLIERFNGQFISAIGHQATADIMSKLLGYNIPYNRIIVKMNVGDIAIVFRLLNRIEEGKVLTEEEIKNIGFEIGFLTRLG